MQKTLIVGALLVAGIGLASVASASDDCTGTSSPVPYGYFRVCALDDHTYSYGTPGSSYYNAGSTNTPASAYTYQSLGPVYVYNNGAVGQWDNTYSYRSYWSSAQSESNNTYAYLHTNARLGPMYTYGGASFNQLERTYTSCSIWGCNSGSSDYTQAQISRNINGFGASVNYRQDGSGAGCTDTVSVSTSLGGQSMSQACTQELPNLYRTQPLPDWPEL